jgi:hypothetical protein
MQPVVLYVCGVLQSFSYISYRVIDGWSNVPSWNEDMSFDLEFDDENPQGAYNMFKENPALTLLSSSEGQIFLFSAIDESLNINFIEELLLYRPVNVAAKSKVQLRQRSVLYCIALDCPVRHDATFCDSLYIYNQLIYDFTRPTGECASLGYVGCEI